MEIFREPPPSAAERYCAWYGDARAGILYYGQAAFWSGFRGLGSDPLADLRQPGPQRIGRFDLARGRLLEPLDVTAEGSRSGVWDVLAAPDRVWFTTYFEAMGSVEPASGRVQRLPELGSGLNELAPGPDGGLLVSRYGGAAGGGILVLDPGGGLLAEHALAPPRGYRVAAKTVAFDPGRRELWATTDLLPTTPGSAPAVHPAYVLAEDGRELRRIERPEIQFVAFDGAGRGWFAEVEGASLVLRRLDPDGRELRLALDDRFPSSVDFAQDIHFDARGRTVLTRWSGLVHVVEPGGAFHTLRLPTLEPGGLYYSGVAAADRICATHCGGVSVVCVDAPDAARAAGAPGPVR